MTAGLQGYEYQSDFARKFYSEGVREGKAEIVLTILIARGIAITDDARRRITTCTDSKQVEAWAVRAGAIENIEELFD